MKKTEDTKNAFVAIVGRPNVGKSSLLNKMLGQKISIVSAKPQTTQIKIMGVLTEGNVQIVFIDTPGVHRPKNILDEHMVQVANESVQDTDLGLLVVEAGKNIHKTELDLLHRFEVTKSKVVLAINKIDLVADKSRIAEQINAFMKVFNFEAVVPVCAKNASGVSDLIQEIKKLATDGVHFFGEDEITDQPERALFAQIIREKLLRFLDQEVPHGVAVCIEHVKERKDGVTDINAIIYCEKKNHKGIIIGKKGAMMKKIGTCARQDIEKFFDRKVNLKLWVKTKEDWRNRENLLMSFIYE